MVDILFFKGRQKIFKNKYSGLTIQWKPPEAIYKGDLLLRAKSKFNPQSRHNYSHAHTLQRVLSPNLL